MIYLLIKESFGTIRNNTALKQWRSKGLEDLCFGTIRNNTALKHTDDRLKTTAGFGTIRNNTALKQSVCQE